MNLKNLRLYILSNILFKISASLLNAGFVRGSIGGLRKNKFALMLNSQAGNLQKNIKHISMIVFYACIVLLYQV